MLALWAIVLAACLRVEASALSGAAQGVHDFKQRILHLTWAAKDFTGTACQSLPVWSGFSLMECKKTSSYYPQDNMTIFLAD